MALRWAVTGPVARVPPLAPLARLPRAALFVIVFVPISGTKIDERTGLRRDAVVTRCARMILDCVSDRCSYDRTSTTTVACGRLEGCILIPVLDRNWIGSLFTRAPRQHLPLATPWHSVGVAWAPPLRPPGAGARSCRPPRAACRHRRSGWTPRRLPRTDGHVGWVKCKGQERDTDRTHLGAEGGLGGVAYTSKRAHERSSGR